MLLVGENQTITLSGNRIHNTSGRSPEVGKQASATSGGIVHIVNNYYDSNYYMGIGPSDDSTTLDAVIPRRRAPCSDSASHGDMR